MSDYIKLTRSGREAHFHAYRVNGVFSSSDGGAVVLLPNGSYDVEEDPEEIIAMIDEIVNGAPRPVAVPNFPGMEK